jgi:hypothetical protein
MSHGPEQHIEHAEHAAHAAHSNYDKRVTISIAIIAAVLACVTMLGHRAHNQTLQLQTLAARESTEASNKWNYYQTKNIFHLQAALMVDELQVFAGPNASPEVLRKMQEKYAEMEKHYDKNYLEKIENDAKKIVEQGKEYLKESEHYHARADRFDYGELALQLAVVLCSLAILTKGRGFWYVGIVSAIVGALITLTGVFDLFLAH